MRVMSYNIRNDQGDDGANAWRRRLPAVAAMWARVDADVVGVQEDWPDQSAWLAERFPGYARVGSGRDADGGGVAVAIFYKTETFRRCDQGDFWLSTTPDVPGSRSFATAVVRKSTWARLADRAGVDWLVVNTHLDHQVSEARRHGAELIRRFVIDNAESACPVVIGDFNAHPDAPPLKLLTEDGLLTDSLAAVGAAMPTFHGFTGEAKSRIDYILIGAGAKATGGEVVHDHLGEVYPSDHFPIYADLTAPAQAHGMGPTEAAR